MDGTTKPENQAEARRLMDAIEGERVRQGVRKHNMTGNTASCPAVYGMAAKRGNAAMTTFIAFCRQLDIEIVLVNNEGTAIS